MLYDLSGGPGSGADSAPDLSRSMLSALPRKEGFLVLLRSFLAGKAPEAWCLAAIDIKRFKLYNEWYGSPQGDALLETLASCLESFHAVQGWPAAYCGNDDFFLCMPNDRDLAARVYDHLQGMLNARARCTSFPLVFGLCTAAQAGGDTSALLRYAQIAVLSSSVSGERMHWFDPAMLAQLKQQYFLLNELERALREGEFCFYLQPKCNSMTRALVGMEALVRWNSPTRGLVSPGAFIPQMEQAGLISQLDAYIWESVCQLLHRWKAQGANIVPISVNVSIADISCLNVAQVFSDLVEQYKLEPRMLNIEITESILAQNFTLVEEMLSALHRRGFSVLMDDFGSGYSSLNMLKDTCVDAIKLDMKLIDLTPENRSRGVQIVESIVGMAHRLDLPIIAEGVENQEQVFMLQAMDCYYAQGYYFYRPMPVEQAEELLARPGTARYWSVHRDMMRRDHRSFNGGRVSAKTAAALQAYQILQDGMLELSLLNLVTGEYHVIKRDPRLPDSDLSQEEDFSVYCQRLVSEKVIHPDDAARFLALTDLEKVRTALFYEPITQFHRFRKHVSEEFVWITMEIQPCRGCSAQEPWAAVLVREDAQTDQLERILSEKRDAAPPPETAPSRT